MLTVQFHWEKSTESGVVETGTHNVTAPTYDDCLNIGFDELTVERKTITNHHTI